MKISTQSQDYVSSIIWKKRIEFAEISRTELRKIETQANPLDKSPQVFNYLLNKMKDLIKTTIDSYALAYQKESKLIDVEDMREIYFEIKKLIKTEEFTISELRLLDSFYYNSSLKKRIEIKARMFAESELIFVRSEMEMNKMLDQNKDRQYEVLRWIFDKVNGHRYKPVNLVDLTTENSKYNRDELERISDYLEGERLIERVADEEIIVQLNHKGIVEIQNSINNPQKPTEHFPAPIIQQFINNISGNIYGGINQQTGSGNTQINNPNNAANLEEKISELVIAVKNSSLSDIQKITTESHLQTVQKLMQVEITPEVSQEVESHIIAVKDVLSTTADLVSLGQIILPMIGHFFHIANF